MWTRKSDQEIQAVDQEAEAKRKSLLRPVYWALPISIVCSLLYSFGYRGGSMRHGFVMYSDPITFFSTKILSVGLLAFGLLYLGMYIHQRRGSLFSNGNILRCDSCHELAHSNPQRLCVCGGRQEPSEYYTWDED